MNLEPVQGSAGRLAPLAARVTPAEPESIRSRRRESGGVEARGRHVDLRAGTRGEVSRAEIDLLVEDVNENLGLLNEKLGFQVHDDTGQIVVQIVDRDSGEIVRESPPREFLDLAARLKEMVGLFLDEQG